MVLLMEEILHHLGCIKIPVNNRINYLSTGAGLLLSTVVSMHRFILNALFSFVRSLIWACVLNMSGPGAESLLISIDDHFQTPCFFWGDFPTQMRKKNTLGTTYFNWISPFFKCIPRISFLFGIKHLFSQVGG